VKEIDPNVFTKSGIIVGLGETEDQVILLMKDLRQVDCDFLTIGQYLAPSKEHLDVVEYVHPEVFKRYEEMAYELGFKHVASSPFVRSSYNAENLRSVLDAEKQASPEA
jgi:lipoic acid synthetase